MEDSVLEIRYTLDSLAEQIPLFWQYAERYPVLAFSGEMGAGKTTFIHALCDFLEVKDAVSSPTFALINEYHFLQDGQDKTIYHMDWYRLRDTEEAIQAGMEDALRQKNAYCFVEWAEKAVDLLPVPHLWIAIEVLSETERTMVLQVKN